MADIIATVGDISFHLQNPSSIGLNRCVTDQLIHDNINQNETYSISGSYQSKQLVPLSKISFNGGSTKTWTISTRLNSFPSDGLTIQGNIGGVSINKTFNSESDVLTIVINDYQNAFDGNNYLNIKRPSNNTNGGIHISGSFQNINGFSVDTNQVTVFDGSQQDNPYIAHISQEHTDYIQINVPYFSQSLGDYGGSFSFIDSGTQIGITVDELT